jgi:hypothetical protein
LLAAATGRGARLEGITVVLLLTGEDDFNALASMVLYGLVDDRVYRLGPPVRGTGVVAPYSRADILFGTGLTRSELERRYASGARIVTGQAGAGVPVGHDVLFRIRADGRLDAVTDSSVPKPQPGDTAVLLAAAGLEPGYGITRPEGGAAEHDVAS